MFFTSALHRGFWLFFNSNSEVAASIDGIAFGADVTDFAALHAAALDAHERLGGLSLLFNNAGGSSMAAIHDWDLAEWQRIITLNLTGVFHLHLEGPDLILPRTVRAQHLAGLYDDHIFQDGDRRDAHRLCATRAMERALGTA